MPFFRRKKDSKKIEEKTNKKNPLEKGIQLFNKQRYKQALKQFKLASEAEPNNSDAHRWIGTTYHALEDYVMAENELKKAIQLDPNNDFACGNLGVLYYYMEQFEEAEHYLKKAIEITPKDCNDRLALAKTYIKLNKRIEAKNEYKEIIEINPEYLKAYNGLFSMLMEIEGLDRRTTWEMFVEFEQIFRSAVKKYPQFALFHSYLGYILMNIEKQKEAEKEFKRALKLNPKDSLATVFIGLKEKGEWKSMGLIPPEN